jgi:K+/H+ antiporter YhaU regulatory subunit KhtT
MECPTINLMKIWESEKIDEKNNEYMAKPLSDENIDKKFDISIINIIKDYETNVTKL